MVAERRTGVHRPSERGLAALGTGGREDSDLVMVMIEILVVMIVTMVMERMVMLIRGEDSDQGKSKLQ